MSNFILLNTEEKILALKDGDKVRIDPNGREFTVCNSAVYPDKIYFHGGWRKSADSEDVIYIKRRENINGVAGIAVWTREELWEALQTGKYYVGV